MHRRGNCREKRRSGSTSVGNNQKNWGTSDGK
ncbi:hypothetical protein A2U01_0115538, partial [Trifolium medium]|nr:hypothetical protein [Trifolium medium]